MSGGCVAPGSWCDRPAPIRWSARSEFAIDPAHPTYARRQGRSRLSGRQKPDEQQLLQPTRSRPPEPDQTLTAEVARRIKVTLANGTPAPFTLRPSISFFEPGSFNGFVNIPSTAKATF